MAVNGNRLEEMMSAEAIEIVLKSAALGSA
jgi:hypothetical protein